MQKWYFCIYQKNCFVYFWNQEKKCDCLDNIEKCVHETPINIVFMKEIVTIEYPVQIKKTESIDSL